MFRTSSTSFVPFQPAYGMSSAGVTEYSLVTTPLGHGHRSSGGSGTGSGSGNSSSSSSSSGGGASASTGDLSHANLYAFHSLLSSNAPPHHHPHQPLPLHHDHHHNAQRTMPDHHIKMEPQSDIAQQEAAARDYKPELEGPLVGEKTTSHAITEEYAKADPIYVAKTMALPQTYSHYRPIQGDGNCGWRAIGFGYFESLVRRGDIARLQDEANRLNELCDYIENVGGYQRYVFEDFTEYTSDLMTEIIEAMTKGQDAMPILVAKFNDEGTSAAIIYHLRLLAASWLKGNFSQYENYIPGDANSYCEEWIMPINREIDQVEVMLLFNVLLNPAGIVLEIAYLDRSEGDKVNVHRMPDDAKDREQAELGPIIHLLYRPGHYDILYREGMVQQPQPQSPAVSTQVHHVASFTHHHDIQSNVASLQSFSTLDMGPLAMLSGFGPAGLPATVASPPTTASPHSEDYGSPAQSTWISTPYSDGLPPTPSHIPQQQPSTPHHQQDPMSNFTSLRFSKHMFPMPGAVDASAFPPEPTFMTNTFKQSHFNTAHYNNPHFQPEEYKPDQDDEIPVSRSGGRKRST
ncbi:peptidase C65 Otubain-domain-containing protein [Xylariales sp. PMI_506]|nr:peptidase C65 Otubain-domain-containing protein [Xylariales sp. PMI_506]